MSTQTAAPGHKKVTLKPVSEFVIEENFNPRTESFGDLKALGKQLKAAHDANPYDIPPVRGHFVNGKGIVVTDGERRIRAAREAGIETLPYLPFSDNMLERLIATSTMNSGIRLNEMENANLAMRIAKAYKEENPKAKDSQVRDFVMQTMGISQASFYNYETLLEVPSEVLERVGNGEISGDLVREIKRNTSSNEELIAQVDSTIKEVNDALGTPDDAPVTKNASGNKSKKSVPRKVKATRQSIVKAKKKATAFPDKSFVQKFEDLVEAIVDSEAPGAQLLLQINEALNGSASLKEVVAIVEAQKVEA